MKCPFCSAFFLYWCESQWNDTSDDSFSDFGEQNAREYKLKFAYERARIFQPQSSIPLLTFDGEIAEKENDMLDQLHFFLHNN